jgi:hypothetical protein
MYQTSIRRLWRNTRRLGGSGLSPKAGHRIPCREGGSSTIADTDFVRSPVVEGRWWQMADEFAVPAVSLTLAQSAMWDPKIAC